MTNHDVSNTSSGSPKGFGKVVTLDGPPRPHGHSGPAGAAFPPLGQRNPRQPLQISIKYYGGPEGQVAVEARGRKWLFGGGVTVHELVVALSSKGYKNGAQPIEGGVIVWRW